MVRSQKTVSGVVRPRFGTVASPGVVPGQEIVEPGLWVTGDRHTEKLSVCLLLVLSVGYSAEQPVRLAIYPVSEVKRVGIAVVAANSEVKRPEPTGLAW